MNYENLLKHIVNIDFEEGNLNELERQVIEAGSKAIKPVLPPPEIGELAEPLRVNDFLEPYATQLTETTNYLGEKADLLKTNLIALNNAITTKIDVLDSLLGDAASAVNEAAFLEADEANDFYWVSDTFNNNSFIDNAKSTVFVDTAGGKLTLGLTKYNKVPWAIGLNTLNTEELKSKGVLPGCNLLALDIQPGSTSAEPQVRYETNKTSELTNLIDDNPNTWFEVEKNYVIPTQKLVFQGKALVQDNSGEYGDVWEKTFGHDWHVSVAWPGDTSATTGLIANFTHLQPKSTSLFQKNLSLPDVDTKVPLSLTIDLEPVLLSNLKIVPMLRPGATVMKINQILAYSPSLSTPFIIAKDFLIDNNKTNTTVIQNELEQKTGLQTTGLNFPIATDRLINKIEIFIEGDISSEVKLAHPFFWINVHRRSVRKYFIFDSVDHIDTEKRVPTSSEPKFIMATINSSFYSEKYGNFRNTNLPSPGTITRQEDKKTLEGLGFLFSPLIDNNLAAKGVSLLEKAGLKFLDIFKNDIGLGSYSSTDEITASKAGYDIFVGYRSAVALKEITLEQIEYQETSVFTSVERSFPEPVNKIGLFADVTIPINWPLGEWVKFEISFDSGKTWLPLEPLMGQDYNQDLELNSPIQTFVLRGVITRKGDDLTTTPTINHYSIRGFKN